MQLNPRKSPTLQAVICYVALLYLITVLRSRTPRIALEDRRLPSIDQERLLNESRQRHRTLQGEFPHRSVSHEVAITIVTAARAQPYVDAVLGSLAGSYGAALPPVTLCNVEGTGGNGRAEELRAEGWEVVDVNAGRPPVNTSRLSQRIAKETGDYWRCLNLTRGSEARYTLLLEDDIVVHDRFSEMLESVIGQLDGRWSPGGRRVDFVKLYHINRLRHISSTPQSIAVALLLTAGLHWLLSPRPLLSLAGYLALLFHLNAQCNLFSADVRFALTQSVYLTMPESCCTPAVLFRTASIAVMVDELSAEPSFAGHAKDHILDESRFTGRESDFNLVSHIGLISSLRRNEIK